MIVAVSTSKKNRLSRVTIKWHRPHRYRCRNHVLIFPTWTYMSCYKLLQSRLLPHLTYLNQSYTHLVAVCHVSCWPKFQSIATDNVKQYQYQSIVLNHKTEPLFLEFNWCKKSFYLFRKIANSNIGGFLLVLIHELVQKFHVFCFSLYLTVETMLMQDLAVETKWPVFHKSDFPVVRFGECSYSFFNSFKPLFRVHMQQ